MKILIVDDNEDNVVLQETVLASHGYTIETADNGVQALEVAARFCPDMIISDILMPEMDGFELCRAVKADKKLKKIPFVFYSASYLGSKDKELAMALGASRYIEKPREMEEFVKIINEMIKEYEDGKLTIPERPELDDKTLERMHEKVLVNKLSEKVEELENEITRRKEVEVRIRKLSQAVEQSPASVIITDKKGNIEYVNPKFSKVTGYTREEVIGKTPRVLKSGEKPPEEYKELWKTITSGNEWSGEFHNKKKNGERYWEYASISPIKDEDGKITHFLAVKEDVTERKKTEQALLESEEKFRTISATANDAIIMADNNGNISYWNKAAEKMFGYSSKEATGKKIHEACIPDRFHEAHLRGFKEFKDTGQGYLIGKTTELTAINSNGTEFPIEFSLSAVKIKGKWNAVAIIRNITERLRIEDKLRVSYKMASLGRLTAGVFHEILNPVNIISSHIQLLLMEAEKGSKTEEDLNSVQEEIARIVKITDSLLRFSRKGEPGSEKIEINDLLEKMISLIEPDMKLDNIRFVRKFDDRLLQISGNRDELRQVFLNLTTNARDAMPDGGTLTFSTKNITGGDVPFIAIKIADTGCGIDKDKIEFIFEPFFTTKKEGKGTGLGLSTSYGIIENHSGVMSVESEVGKGTTFTIDLPVKT